LFPQGFLGLKPFLLVLPVALVLAKALILFRARREGFSMLRVLALQLGVGVFALAGAKAFALAEAGWPLSRALGDLLNYGWRYPGALGGLVLGLLVFRPLLVPGLSLARYADWNAIVVAAGHVVLRWSCFLAGCCVGHVCHGPFCVAFPRESIVWYEHASRSLVPTSSSWSEPVFPLHFAFMAAAALAFVVLWRFDSRRRFDGQTFLLFLVVHDGAKLALEFFRDPATPELRWAALVSVAFGAFGLAILRGHRAARVAASGAS
jgi:phosphatidylglycerol:prolipoprotein diacylglycerol transferase